MNKLIAISLITFASLAGFAQAEDESVKCDAPKDKWMTEEAMKAKATEMGYDVRQVKVEDGCYEVYGIKDGQKVEAIFNPATGEQVGVD
jgi:hypothetical protein